MTSAGTQESCSKRFQGQSYGEVGLFIEKVNLFWKGMGK